MKLHVHTSLAVLALPLALGALSACGPDKGDRPGEKTSDAVEEARKKVDEAADEVGDDDTGPDDSADEVDTSPDDGAPDDGAPDDRE